MANRSIDFNNTAVRLMRVEDQSSTGNVVNPLVALDMFQGALEVLLDETRRLDDQEQRERQGQEEDHRPNGGEVDPASCEEPVMSPPRPPPVAPERPVTQETLNCVQRAEVHLQTINAYFAEQSLTGDNPILPPSLMVQARHDNSRDAIVVPVHSRGYNPYLYKIPFTIAQPMDEDSHLNGSIIVYNIGLAHQLLDSASVVAPVFYQKAAALLSSVMPISNDTLLLRLSLVNNYGVSCAENGDGETMRTCMEQLARSLDEHESLDHRTDDSDGLQIDATIRDGFRSNIQHLLTPSHGGSPVA